jgi:hypothetical protein
MEKISLSKQQSKDIAKTVYSDIKGYCQKNVDRYIPWLINDIRKSKGMPPLEPIDTKGLRLDYCAFCKFMFGND